MFPVPQVGALPQFLALEVEAVHPRRGEAHHHTLTVGRGRSVAVPAGVPVALLLRIGHVLLPLQLAAGTVETQEAAYAAPLVGLRQKDVSYSEQERNWNASWYCNA